MNSFTFAMAFLMGLTGSLHCAGMCGPIALVLPFQLLKGFKRAIAILLYHFGRISMYAFLALILHTFRSLFHPQWQQYISIAVGSLLLLIGLVSFMPGYMPKIKLPWTEFAKKQIGAFAGNPNITALFISGILNGLLPCGLVYMALSASMAATSNNQAIALMYVFGFGTMPMLIAITILKTKAKFLKLNNIRKLVPVTLFALGSLFVVRGMNLGIPYLSPKITVTMHGVKAQCCHKH
jgi:sulfite exporter TauE/SafE